MKKLISYLFIILISFNLNSFAGPFTDDFAKCLVTKTTAQEKTDLVKWIYVTISFHPQLSKMSNLTAEDVEMANIRVADYMTNVFAYKCNDELNLLEEDKGIDISIYEDEDDFINKLDWDAIRTAMSEEGWSQDVISNNLVASPLFS